MGVGGEVGKLIVPRAGGRGWSELETWIAPRVGWGWSGLMNSTKGWGWGVRWAGGGEVGSWNWNSTKGREWGLPCTFFWIFLPTWRKKKQWRSFTWKEWACQILVISEWLQKSWQNPYAFVAWTPSINTSFTLVCSIRERSARQHWQGGSGRLMHQMDVWLSTRQTVLLLFSKTGS